MNRTVPAPLETNVALRHRRPGRRPRKTSPFVYVVLVILAALVLVPFFWMVSTSFKTPEEVIRVPLTLFPDNLFNLRNYAEVFERLPFLRYLINSTIVSVVAVSSSLVFSSLAGYGFAKFRFPGRNLLFFGVIALLMVPFQSIAVALYNMIAKFGLVDTYAGIALPQLVSAFGVYLMREAAEQIPNDYIDAARIDGCGEFHIFRAVVLPQLKPYIATLTVIKFMWVWNEFFWPLIVINSENLKVVTLGLTAFSNMYFTEYHLATAASLLSMLPVLVLFLLFQRWFIQAVSMSGLKG